MNDTNTAIVTETTAPAETNVVSLEEKKTEKAKAPAKRSRKPAAKKKTKKKETAKKTTTSKKVIAADNKTNKNDARLAAFYSRYPWVVAGSVKAVPKGEVVDGVVSKGRMCKIKCVDTGKLRTINTSDAFQTKRTVEAQLEHARNKRRSSNAKVNSKPAK